LEQLQDEKEHAEKKNPRVIFDRILSFTLRVAEEVVATGGVVKRI
jgi:hypothetical protein